MPVALLATLLPAAVADAPVAPLAIIGVPMWMLAAEVPHSAGPDTASLACIAWIVGCLLFAGHLALQQYRFVRGLGGIKSNGDGLLLADAVAGLPAVIGLWKPRIVLPADALSRYDTAERGLMLAHEREHIARGDLIANAFVAALRCLFWFNPLLHIAARRFRDDQEPVSYTHLDVYKRQAQRGRHHAGVEEARVAALQALQGFVAAVEFLSLIHI